MFRKLVFTGVLGLGAMLQVGCGGLVKGVCFETFQPPVGENQAWGQIKVKWAALTQGLVIGEGRMPIFGRVDGSYEVFGEVRNYWDKYRTDIDGRPDPGPNTVIEFDIGKISQQPAQDAAHLLPNGEMVPIGCTITNEGNQTCVENMFKLALNNPNNPNKPVKDFIYFSASESALIVGTTFQVSGLDKLAQKYPIPSGFLPIADAMTGETVFAGGIYLSQEESKSGIGVFTNATKLIEDTTGQDPNQLCYGANGRSRELPKDPPMSNVAKAAMAR